MTTAIIIITLFFAYMMLVLLMAIVSIVANERVIKEVYLQWTRKAFKEECCETKSIQATIMAAFADGRTAAYYFMTDIKTMQGGQTLNLVYPEQAYYKMDVIKQAYQYAFTRVLETEVENKVFWTVWAENGMSVICLG